MEGNGTGRTCAVSGCRKTFTVYGGEEPTERTETETAAYNRQQAPAEPCEPDTVRTKSETQQGRDGGFSDTPVIWLMPCEPGAQNVRLTVTNEGGNVLFSYGGLPYEMRIRFCIKSAVRTGTVTVFAVYENGKIVLQLPV